jgi:lipoate-protein ligase A
MLLYQQTFEESAANLAFDEALLENADVAWTAECPMAESLRVWEPRTPMVVLGRSSCRQQEVNLDYCHQHDIPVLRRCSGGATIVTGPGCLMYAVVLRYADKPELRLLDRAHAFVLNQIRAAIEQLGLSVTIQGTSDLTIGNRKFSGNSLRCRRNGFLYHGTLICDFDLGLVAKCLQMPRRQPAYRASRRHDEFLTRLPFSTQELGPAIIRQWRAESHPDPGPMELTARLMEEKYLTQRWLDTA